MNKIKDVLTDIENDDGTVEFPFFNAVIRSLVHGGATVLYTYEGAEIEAAERVTTTASR